MILLLLALVTARREPSFSLYPLAAAAAIPYFFSVICTPNSAELLQQCHRGDGGGSSITAAENLK